MVHYTFKLHITQGPNISTHTIQLLHFPVINTPIILIDETVPRALKPKRVVLRTQRLPGSECLNLEIGPRTSTGPV